MLYYFTILQFTILQDYIGLLDASIIPLSDFRKAAMLGCENNVSSWGGFHWHEVHTKSLLN